MSWNGWAGWLNRDVVDWYGEYASILKYCTFGEYGSLLWATVNEPITTIGICTGRFCAGL